MKFSYQNTIQISTETVVETATKLAPYIAHLQTVVKEGSYNNLECSINLPTDDKLLEQVKIVLQEKVSPRCKYIIDIGIGGSNLGTKAVYDALFGCFDVLESDRFPKIIFLDTNDPRFLKKLLTFFQSKIATVEEFVINAISKSGGTTETIANLEIVLASLQPRFPHIYERLVITTDEGSRLHVMATEKNITTLTMPKQVGGRYSVLSAVGLFPLAALGVDIQKLRLGATEMRATCVDTQIENNPAALSAAILYFQYKHGKNIHDTFFFDAELESLGKWYRQLMGESVGKEHNIRGEKVNVGITPTVSIGSTDLHSMGQLYLGGPKDKVTTFVSVVNHDEDVHIPSELQFPLIEHIEGKQASQIMSAILEGVKAAYTKQQLTFMEVALSDISAESLGAFLQFKMIEMMYLGQLMEVNPFDQPQVELYKTETKRILSMN